MKKPRLKISGTGVRYRLYRKYRNLYRRVNSLLESENPAEKELKRTEPAKAASYENLSLQFFETASRIVARSQF